MSEHLRKLLFRGADMTIPKHTGYGIHNKLLDELEELKQLSQLRANDLKADELTRARAQATADAYAYCQHRLMALPKH